MQMRFKIGGLQGYGSHLAANNVHVKHSRPLSEIRVFNVN